MPRSPKGEKRSALKRSLPSREKKRVWLWAGKSSGDLVDDGALVVEDGKWLIFRTHATVDEAWSRVVGAIRSGYLECAKASTRHPVHSFHGEKHVICVYTRDDEASKAKVLTELRRAGFVESLPYKSDWQTLTRAMDKMRENSN